MKLNGEMTVEAMDLGAKLQKAYVRPPSTGARGKRLSDGRTLERNYGRWVPSRVSGKPAFRNIGVDE